MYIQHILKFNSYFLFSQSFPTLSIFMDCSMPGFPVLPLSWSLLKLMFIELMMPSNHLLLCMPLSSCFQSFPASGSIPISQLFTSGSQRFGCSSSASVLPMNIQG